MAQQTAMQQLIKWMEDMSEVIPFDQGSCYDKAIELLQMEKEQVELKYKDGTPMRKYNSPKLQEIEMENKQTAVEWLFEKLWDEPKDKFTWYALREKAIQMEKEQNNYTEEHLEMVSSQTEISDEKIAEKAEEFEYTDGIYGFKQGVKWYREQLK